MKVLLIGGYGRTGIQIVRLLLGNTDLELILGGRHLCRADDAREILEHDYGAGRITTVAVDAGNRDSVAEAASGCDLVIVCAQTGPFRAETAGALLDIGIDCIEINAGSYEDWESSGAYKKLKDSGHSVIAEAGILPGLPSLLVKQASIGFDRIENAVIGHLMRLEKWDKTEIENFLSDLEFKSGIYADGSWREVSWKEYRRIDFGPPYGISACSPYILPEILELPGRYQLGSLGLYAAELGHWSLNWLLFLYVIAGGGKSAFFRWLTANLMHGCHRRFLKLPFGLRLKFEADGSIEGRKWKIETVIDHPDVYRFTAIAITALVQQWLDGSIRRPGLYMMGDLVDPERFLADMKDLGAEVTSKLSAVQKG